MIVLGWWLACAPEPAAAPEAPAWALVGQGPSLYDLEVDLVDASGRTVPFDVHRGRPTVVSMFYASCPSACPMLIERLAAVEDGLPPERRDELRVLLVSLDPTNDTPDALREAAARHELDLSRWTLASPTPDRVREVAAVMGVTYKPTTDGEMNHTSVLALLDGEGRLVTRVDLARDGTEPLAEALARGPSPR